jgi:hypothetical protein
MDVIGFLCVSLGSSTVQLRDSLGTDAHAYVQRLVSVVNMANVLEDSITDEKSSVLPFFVGKRTQCKGRIFYYLWWEEFIM